MAADLRPTVCPGCQKGFMPGQPCGDPGCCGNQDCPSFHPNPPTPRAAQYLPVVIKCDEWGGGRRMWRIDAYPPEALAATHRHSPVQLTWHDTGETLSFPDVQSAMAAALEGVGADRLWRDRLDAAVGALV